MLHMKRSALILAGWVIISAGCNIQTDSGPSSTLTIAPPLNPYQTPTQTLITQTPTKPLSTEQPFIPSPTPFRHTVQAGETLYGIALQYNISLDRLASANPGLDSRNLIVGTKVVIPFTDNENQLPTPTPYPILVEKPICYSTTDEGLWCYSLIENNQNLSLENISITFNIYDSNRDLVKSQIAHTPLNFLFPKQILPAGELITDPPANIGQISTTLLTAYPSDRKEPLVLVTDYFLVYSQENTIVQVEGTFEIADEVGNGDQVWIAGVGFSEGNPVAIRKWISSGALEKGTPYPFDFLLYSLGPEIDQVQVFSELH